MARRPHRTLTLVLMGAVVVVALFALTLLRSPPTVLAAAPAQPADEANEADPVDDQNAGDDAATDPVPLASTASSGLRALFGEVTDPAGTSLAGATVMALLDDGSTETRTTDGEGAFALDGLRAPILRVLFRAPGYGEVSVMGATLPAVAEAFWSQKLAPAFAEGAGRVEGLVVDGAGAPVVAYRLMTTPTATGERRRSGRGEVTEVADANGAFSREATGSLALMVIASGFRPSDPVVIDVEPGRVERVRIVLERSNALSGRVTDAATGAPIAGAIVALDHVRGLAPVITDADGRYLIASLPKEKASIVVRAEGYTSLTLGGVEGGRSRDEALDVKLTPRSTASGAVTTTEVVGIGVGVRGGADGVHVSEVFANGPAHGALEKGDVIIEVDGVSMVGKALREGMSAIRGDSGSTIRLRVAKPDGSTKTVSLERARVSVPEG